MLIETAIRKVFAHFQNLNLLALVHDLEHDGAARADWSARHFLCPVAHGLASAQQVREVNLLNQMANLRKACDYAANCLGAQPGAVIRFVRSWDEHVLTREELLWHLRQLWDERLADAIAVQQVIQGLPVDVGG